MRTKQSLISNLRLLGPCFLLGFLLTPVMAVGQGPDFAEMFELASQGEAYAQYNLGLMYDNGQGVPQDYKAAVKWYSLAAEQGHAFAQYNLGVSYTNGEGVIQDNVYAHMWFNIAASSGDSENASGNRDIIAGKMTTAQIAEAQKLARECVRKEYKGC
jgi:TPR repeat protein